MQGEHRPREDSPIVIDLRREGWTNVDNLAKALLKDTLPDYFSLAGLSFGGYVALSILRQAPERVERLALLSSQARSDAGTTRERRQRLTTLARRDGGLDSVMDLLGPTLVHPYQIEASRRGSVHKHGNGPEANLEIARQMASDTGVVDFARQQAAAGSRRDQSDLLARLALPTLILCGRQDGIIPFAAQQAVASAAAASSPALSFSDPIPVARSKAIHPPRDPTPPQQQFELRFRQLSPCGHLSPLEQPDAVARELRGWMALEPAPVAAGGSALLPPQRT
jgi:pimeloyl-ACP methyl ester carboxylesterase